MSPPPPAFPRFRLVQGKALGERSPLNPGVPSISGAGNSELQPQVQPHQQQVQPLVQVANVSSQPESPQIAQTATSVAVPNSAHNPGNALPTVAIAPMVQVNTASNSTLPPQPPPSNAPAQPQPQPVYDERHAVTKCCRFLRTLLNLSSNQNSENATNSVLVRHLIQHVLYGDLSAEEFTSRLQQALNSQAQPHLLPFLQNTIPALRTAVRSGEVVIDGISPPPGYVFNKSRQQEDQMRPGPSPHMTQTNPSSHLASRLSTVSQQGTVMQSQTMAPTQQQIRSIPQMQIHQSPQIIHKPVPPPPQQNQVVINQPSIPIQQQTISQPVQIPAMQPSTSQPIEPKQEEEAIGARTFVENSLKSAILSPQEIMNRITARMKQSCMVEEEALMLISDAAESHLRELITQVAGIAEHRVESIRIGENYEPIDDTKRQLRFLEDLDRQEEEMRESREKEALLRMSKNKNAGKETADKIKEIQRVEAEAKRNRDANAAAIAALSGNRTFKNKFEGSSSNASSMHRPRTVRVTTRDLHILVNNDNRFHGTFIREKLAYGGPAVDTTI
ncbi:unnamed protein product [Caenorhabditis bovis]|uniref:TAFH domain-containing protein n=1 Tax=Caenorhabditis bovis TaxID=2654633 RepID=A0A8S1FE16_9PELO|nr:unnamed protein product [Caenorhabditis bovis]